MPWDPPPQWLPRRRQRQSDISPPKPKQVVDNNGIRRRVTSGGSVVRNGPSSALGEDSTNTDSSFGTETQTEFVPPELVVQFLENPVHEPIPELTPPDDREDGFLPFPLSQVKIDQLHEEVVGFNLVTVSNLSQDEWMFD